MDILFTDPLKLKRPNAFMLKPDKTMRGILVDTLSPDQQSIESRNYE